MRVFPDNDLSAAADDVVRPEYERLREAIERGEVAHVWAVEQYRVERREIPWFQFAAVMDDAGISELHTNRDGIVRVRDEVAGIKAVLGAGEVRRMKRRINDKLADQAAQGVPAGSRPFGYRHGTLADGTRTYVQVPAEAAALRQAAEWVLSGWSLSNIASELRGRGLRGAHGGKVTPGSVRSSLLAPTIAGHRVYRGEIVARGNWTPVLDHDTWQACRVRLTQPRRVRRADGKGTYPITEKHNGHAGRRYLLTGGLAVCGVCGKPLAGAMKSLRNQRQAPYLLCHPTKGGKGCVGTLLEKAETVVVERLFAELDKPEFVSTLAADEHAGRRDEISTALDNIDRQRGELAALWATPGELTAAEWSEARRGLGENEQALPREYATLPPPELDVDVAGARQAWPDMTLDEQRAFLRLFVASVTLHPARPGAPRVFDPERLEIVWRTL